MNLRIYTGIASFIMVCATVILHTGFVFAGSPDLYFPPTEGKWEKVALREGGWDAKQLKMALDYAGDQNSSGVVVLYGGRMVAEQYWEPGLFENQSTLYKYMLMETTADGRTIEDVASVQKSVISFLAAKARDQGILDIDRTVTSYIGKGWSQASPEQESSITVRHLMSMTSGLNEWLKYAHPAGTVWEYRTMPYSMMIPVLAKATGMDIDQLTYAWLTSLVGMRESHWGNRKWVQHYHPANTFGFMTSARDLARFGLLVLAQGKWQGKSLFENSNYLSEALQPSQDLKRSYGLLWWRLGQGNIVAALGKLSRAVLIVPDKQIVIVRIGDQPKDSKRDFRHKFWKLISAAMPNEKGN